MTHVDIDPFLLDQGFVFVHEDAFGHGEECLAGTRVVDWRVYKSMMDAYVYAECE